MATFIMIIFRNGERLLLLCKGEKSGSNYYAQKKMRVMTGQDPSCGRAENKAMGEPGCSMFIRRGTRQREAPQQGPTTRT